MISIVFFSRTIVNRKRLYHSSGFFLFFLYRSGSRPGRFSGQFAAINARSRPDLFHTRSYRFPDVLSSPFVARRRRQRRRRQRRKRERVGDRSGVTDNLTPGLNGLLAHNISRYPGDRIRDITIWKWRGPRHDRPSIGQRTPQARPISVTLMRRIGYTGSSFVSHPEVRRHPAWGLDFSVDDNGVRNVRCC